MDYTNEFLNLLQYQDYIDNGKLFILKNDKPKNIKVFPKIISDTLIEQYFEKLKIIIKEKTFVDYIPDEINKSTFQVLPTKKINLWQPMIEARTLINLTNNESITVEDYNCDGNTILTDLPLNNGKHIYFLTIYKSVAAWFRNSTWFHKENGTFREMRGNALMLTPYVDAVIYEDKCYIINEINFNRIFKYDEVIENQVAEHKEDILSMNFIDDTNTFMHYIYSSTNAMKSMAKILLQKKLDEIKKFTPQTIRQRIKSQPKLDFIQFDENDKIIIDEKSSKVVVDILRGEINIDVITGDLNGVE